MKFLARRFIDSFFVSLCLPLTMGIASCSKKDKTATACAQQIKMAPRTAQEAFTHNYQVGEWGRNANGEGCSGGGSLPCYAKPYMIFLKDFLETNHIKSVVDIGCGDWEFSQHIDWNGIRYMGVDVVKHMIQNNIQKFETDTISFVCADATEIELPNADLLLCKDVMQHILNKDITLLCEKFAKFKYCIITNDVVNPSNGFCLNEDLPDRGGLRAIDLTAPPFNISAIKVLSYPADSNNIKEVLLIEKK